MLDRLGRRPDCGIGYIFDRWLERFVGEFRLSFRTVSRNTGRGEHDAAYEDEAADDGRGGS